MRIVKQYQIFLQGCNSGISNHPDPEVDPENGGSGSGGGGGNTGDGDQKQDPP